MMGMITDDQMIPKSFEVAWEVTGGVCCSEFHIRWRWSILKRPWKFDKHINQRQVLLFNEWKRRRCVKMWLAGRGRWPAQPLQSSVGHQTTTPTSILKITEKTQIKWPYSSTSCKPYILGEKLLSLLLYSVFNWKIMNYLSQTMTAA